MPQLWVFAERVQNGSKFYDIGGLQHVESFMFDGRHGANIYVEKLQGILMWNFWMLEVVGIISSNAYSFIGYSLLI